MSELIELFFLFLFLAFVEKVSKNQTSKKGKMWNIFKLQPSIVIHAIYTLNKSQITVPIIPAAWRKSRLESMVLKQDLLLHIM